MVFIFMNENKKKQEKKEPFGFVIFLKKGTKKGTYNNYMQEMRLRTNEMFFR